MAAATNQGPPPFEQCPRCGNPTDALGFCPVATCQGQGWIPDHPLPVGNQDLRLEPWEPALERLTTVVADLQLQIRGLVDNQQKVATLLDGLVQPAHSRCLATFPQCIDCTTGVRCPTCQHDWSHMEPGIRGIDLPSNSGA